MKQKKRIGRRAIVLAGLGSLVGLGLLAAGGASSSGGTAFEGYWVCDRGGGAVYGVDAGLATRRFIPLVGPVRLAASAAKRGVWVARATQGFALGPHEVSWFPDGGLARWTHAAGPVVDLSSDDEAAVWVEWPLGAPEQVVWADVMGRTRRLKVTGPASCAAVAEDRVLVGRSDGWLELWDLNHPPQRLEAIASGTQIGDVVPGPAGGWYALDLAERRVLSLDANLTEVWSIDLGLSPLSLTTSLDLERVWIVDANEPFVRRYGPNGTLELSVGNLPLGGFDRAAPTPTGGLMLVAPGAVLELDAAGTLLQSQGGFGFLTDIVPVR